MIAACRPNRAHTVLAAWTHRDGWRVVTQNVDDLHVDAGTRDLVRLHGSIWEVSCWAGCAQSPKCWRDERVPLDGVKAAGTLPRCPHCGGLARPAVVWFGESLDPHDVRLAQLACRCDVFIAAGTSALVHPAAGLVVEARARGAFTAEVNLEPTPATGIVDVAIQGRAEEVFEEIDAIMGRLPSPPAPPRQEVSEGTS
jgi:NAD-dependent deacetylase